MTRQLIGALAFMLIPAAAFAQSGIQHAAEAYGKLPLVFEANQGQTSPEAKFLARTDSGTLWLTPSEAVIRVARGGKQQPGVMRMRLAGAPAAPQLEGLDPLPGRSNYLSGNNPAAWRTAIPQYGRVRYREAYPGVDLIYYGNHRQLEYDFVVAPGADPRRIRLTFAGARKIRVDAEGNLRLGMAGAGDEVRLQKPVVYQEFEGVRRPVEGKFEIHGGEVGFALGTYDPDKTLVIDPVLLYSTFVGGSSVEIAYGVAVDAAGSAYITGNTLSTDFPVSGAFQMAKAPNVDAFLAKLNPAGSALVYATYFGGNGLDVGTSIAVDSYGNASVTGYTTSTDFPVVNALQSTFGGNEDAFICKFNAAGSGLVYSTYLGGSEQDAGSSLAVDAAGSAYVTGFTKSGNFPVVHPLQSSNSGNGDGFVTKLNAAGAAVYSTYLGGSGYDAGLGIAVDGSGNAYITGRAASFDFPLVNPLQISHSASSFVAKVNASGSGLVYSTYLGGQSGGTHALAVAVDTAGNAYVAGETFASDFPVVNALQPSNHGQQNGFIAKLNPPGNALVYATYLGGSGTDSLSGIAVDASGAAYVAGYSMSPDFPAVNAIQLSLKATHGHNAIAAKLNPSGSALVYSTYLGGSGDDVAAAIAVDHAGNAYVTGSTASSDFPTKNSLQASLKGFSDAFLAKIGEAYHFSGFFSPVADPPSVNSGKAGRTYPLKWELTDSSGALVSSPAVIHSITYQTASCATFAPIGNAVNAAANGGGLKTDSSQYHYNWDTPKQPGCYLLTIALSSGQTFTANFNLF